MWWSNEWVDVDLNAPWGGLWDICSEPPRQHTPATSGADGDVGESMLFGECESCGDVAPVYV